MIHAVTVTAEVILAKAAAPASIESSMPSKLIADVGKQNGARLIAEYAGPLVSVPLYPLTVSFAVVPLPSLNE